MAELICAADLKQFDPLHLGDIIRALEAQGIDEIHLDVADGRFIPRHGFSPRIVGAIKAMTALPCHLHLLVEAPDRLLNDYLKCGADTVTLHLETCTHIHRALAATRDAGVAPGVAVCATTSLTKINYLLPQISRLLLLGTDPAFPAQLMPRAAFERMKIASENIRYHEYDVAVEAEGVMGHDDAARCQRFGVHRVVVGPRDVPGLGDAAQPEVLRDYRARAAAAVHTV